MWILDKTLNDMVPQLIPREPVNIDGVKPGFNTIRTTIQTNEMIHVEIDPTSNAPIAVFDGKKRNSSIDFIRSSRLECDIHIPINQQSGKCFFLIHSLSHLLLIASEESISLPITSLSSTYHPPASPNFPRLTPCTTFRRSSSRSNV